MSWLLDTDVICQPAKKNGGARVVAWLEAEQDRCYTSAGVIVQVTPNFNLYRAYLDVLISGSFARRLPLWLSNGLAEVLCDTLNLI